MLSPRIIEENSGDEQNQSSDEQERVEFTKPRRVRVYSSTCHQPEPVLRVGNRTIFTRGRPPWYGADGQPQESFVIGICGGSGSGKTTVSQKIIERLNIPWVSLLSMDSYYRNPTPDEMKVILAKKYNFDHPNAFDFNLLRHHLCRLREGKSIEVPEYDFKIHGRTSKTKTIYGANVVIIEGVLTFYSKDLTDMMDLKIFVDTDADERLSRRLIRDISERGRAVPDVILQYNTFVKPSYDQFIAPTMAIADIIIPRGGENAVALDLITQHVKKRLEERGHFLRPAQAACMGFHNGNGDDHTDCCHEALAMSNGIQPWGDVAACGHNGCFPDPAHFMDKLPPRVHVMTLGPQTRALHTLIRDRSTTQDSFIFYTNRLMRSVCEYACTFLPYEDVVVDTPQGMPYPGRRLATNTQVCGISILRAGEAFEQSLCAVCKDVRLGKILIQTNPETKEPELHYLRLPSDIKNCYVLLMDSTVASGAAAIMAMRVLVDHDVPEDHIILVSLIMAAQGVNSVAYAYPSAHIVTTAVDNGLTKDYHILPGIGNFGDRYFGTSLSP